MAAKPTQADKEEAAIKFSKEVLKSRCWKETLEKEHRIDARTFRQNVGTFRVPTKNLASSIVPATVTEHNPQVAGDVHHDPETLHKARAAYRAIQNSERVPVQAHYYTQTEQHEIGWLLTRAATKRVQQSQKKWGKGRRSLMSKEFT